MRLVLKLFVIYLGVICADFASSVNVLGLMGASSPSHHLWNSVVLHEMASKGHNVTVLSADVSDDPPPGVHYIQLEETYLSLFNDSDRFDLSTCIEKDGFTTVKLINDFFVQGCRGAVRSKGFQRLLEYPDNFKFDLILYDIAFCPCLIGFVHKFNYPPIVGLNAFKMYPGVIDHSGGHSHPAYIPFYGNTLDVRMNFWERLYNTWIYFLDHVFKHFYCIPKMEKLVREKFSADMPSLHDLEKLTKLVLTNTHPAVDYAESLPPNVIEVGGLQIKDPKPLPDDIQSFLKSSKKGTIYIAMGTNVKSDLVGESRSDSIIEVISKMPEYNFLWKYDPDSITKNLPKNVLVKKWFPQSDILADPNIKVFVTHAGSLSVQEAVWYGKPMVAIPFFVDQPRNAFRLSSLGMGERVNFKKLNANDLYDAVKKVATNPSYTETVKRHSRLFRDAPMKPLDRAMWWIDFVLRHPNPDHLSSVSKDIGFIKANLIDVYIFIVLVFLIIIIVFYILLKNIFLFLFSNRGKAKLKRN